ncbi:peptide ABC transporter substrate-binding protein [Mesobacillus maritimus]|uniref:peptide ABC transporter substrate-binding protein n=1 Tax=Mesobacillus maritimus TaxID=1643336 RepID=UPI00203DA667|nr:peptide ABC transporter substrate-binding protein [Mesobacillus maritimus]MCM3588188.1 peptide ABC transporter substrate-binding protein [Mesobacillus maritimus]MCM3668878.1 peptide ABC transporter substrate-binding protein [Mesobacillus maritimus]
MKRKFAWLLSLGLVLSMFLAACSGGGDDTSDKPADEGSDQAAEGGEQVLNLINGDTIPSMDPSLATDEYGFQFLGATMEGLYRLDENAQPVEGIAVDHKVSEDGLTWTFELREDAKWENGDPVTANDFVYAWQRAVNPDTGSEYGPYMMGGVIKNATAVNEGKAELDELGVKAEDDYTLVVELEHPTPYFHSLTTFGTFLPLNQKFVEEQGDKFATSTETLLSNGPFKLDNWTSTSNEWDLVKNDTYWDADTVKVEKLHHQVVKDPKTAVALYEEGTVDRAGLSSDLVDQYSTHEDYAVTPETSVFYLKLNQTRNEALANVNIRKAISLAFDKQALVDEILNNGSIVANGLVPKDFVTIPGTEDDFRDVSGDLAAYNAEEAKKFWEKGLEELGTDSVELEFLGGDTETSKVMNEYLANQLQTNLPGLKVTLKQVPFEQRLDLDTNMDYDMQFAGWGPDYLDPYTFLSLWITDGGNNKMGYSNAKYDELLNEAATTLAQDNEARYQNFLEAEKILFEDAAIAPVYQSAMAQLVSPKIQGVYVNPFGATYEYKWASVGSAE